MDVCKKYYNPRSIIIVEPKHLRGYLETKGQTTPTNGKAENSLSEEKDCLCQEELSVPCVTKPQKLRALRTFCMPISARLGVGGIPTESFGQTRWRRSLELNELEKLRLRLAKTDKYLAKLYRWNAQLASKINRVQRERQKLVRSIEALEVRCGQR